jgi:hypothetical protein
MKAVAILLTRVANVELTGLGAAVAVCGLEAARFVASLLTKLDIKDWDVAVAGLGAAVAVAGLGAAVAVAGFLN